MGQASTCTAAHHASYDRYDFQDQAGQVSETWSWYSKKTSASSELLQVQEEKPPTRTVDLALVETSSASGSAVGSKVSSTTVPDTGYPDVNAHRYNYYGVKLAVSDPVDYFKGSVALNSHKVGTGLCNGNLIRVYNSDADNPGTTILESREACASACANKKTPVSTSDTTWNDHPGVVLGFAVIAGTGRCHCETQVCEGLSAK